MFPWESTIDSLKYIKTFNYIIFIHIAVFLIVFKKIFFSIPTAKIGKGFYYFIEYKGSGKYFNY